MYKVLRNIENLHVVSKELPQDVQAVLSEHSVNTLLVSLLTTLESFYGADRDLEKDLGGYVVVFYGKENEITEEYRKLLLYHHLKQNEFEYEDIYLQSKHGTTVTFRLYQCSSDYSVVTVEIHKKEKIDNEDNQ